LSISIAERPLLARDRAIDLSSILFRIRTGVPSRPIASKRESRSLQSRFADCWLHPSRSIQPLLPTDGEQSVPIQSWSEIFMGGWNTLCY
jgi:hypothetical protein